MAAEARSAIPLQRVRHSLWSIWIKINVDNMLPHSSTKAANGSTRRQLSLC